jgi:hypothetical protein
MEEHELTDETDGDPIARFAGALTGVYAPDELDDLRDEWDD